MKFGVQQQATGYQPERSSRSVQCGWRVPLEVYQGVCQLADEQGIARNKFVTRLLREQVEILRQPISSAELEKRIHFPEHLRH